MLDTRAVVNSLGLLLTIVGVYVVYRNSPLNESNVDGGIASTDFEATERRMNRTNRLLRVGVYLVLAGGLLQLASNFIPPGLWTCPLLQRA
jgi:hypothetical protein